LVDTLFEIEKGVVKRIIEMSNHPDHIGYTKILNNPVKKTEKKIE